ncbi:Transcriptional regulatory protein ZraR [Symmachiella macrocystis]|uniref:Transcriptional regulatory protein ZraR n=1 Tax=Symmachiella macrocystis TaxID=2527985 RepID=A0A5C6BS00_9PLAN|nr:sigma-54 dependent transcriptional regulator [Symmachiella macrocystis]TWU13464.1 Transcriptional regulatory protein ZraR [Symmachiella macrocystis]
MNGKVLVVDDEQSMCELIDTDLRLRGMESSWCTSANDALRTVQEQEFDVVLTDVRMPGTDGLQLCRQITDNRPDIPVVVMTAFGSLETAVAAIRAGAYDFVTKPIEMDLLALTIERACKHSRLQQQVQVLSEAVQRTGRFGEMLGDSQVMHGLYDQLARIADSEASVLITGESGTGKELVARSIHQKSRRVEKPFVAVNCAALSETLLESELFGHSKGAFTDARTERKGLFLEAEGGTLLLDEMGEMPMAMQVKLLRALEENRVRPVGSDKEIPFDVRILTATNRDLESAVEENRFREDLYYRINVIQVELPPLRSRGMDVLLLSQHYVEQFAERAKKEIVGISEQAAEKLLSYSWPGNIRELRNIMERAVALTRFDKIAVEDLPEKIRNYQSSQVFIGGSDPTELVSMEEVERRYILHVLETVDQNKTLAARVLGLDRKTLYRKLKQYGVDND